MKFLILSLTILINTAFAGDNFYTETIDLQDTFVNIDNDLRGGLVNMKIKFIRTEESPNYITVKYRKNNIVMTTCVERDFHMQPIGSSFLSSTCTEYRTYTNFGTDKFYLNLNYLAKLEPGDTQEITVKVTQSELGINAFKRDFMKYTIDSEDNPNELRIFHKRFRTHTLYVDEQ